MKSTKRSYKKKRKLNKLKILEKNWDERFILEKIPQYNAYKDINYLSLGLVKSKIRYEESQKKNSLKKAKKLRHNSSRHTLNSKNKKNIQVPFLSLRDSDNQDLFYIKQEKRPQTIKKIKINKTLDYDKKQEKYKKDKEYYIKTYDNYNSQDDKKDNEDNEDDNNDKENIVIDQELQDELNIIKDLWENLGVTQEYQVCFGEMLDSLKKRKIVEKYLSYEKKQLLEFKSDLEKLMNDIYKRENDLLNLKKIEEIYTKNEELNKYNLLKNKKIQNNKNSNDNLRNTNLNEYDGDNVEKSVEYNEELNKYKLNKEKIENDVGNCLKLLRLHTINTVNQFTKFRINYNFFFTSGKNDVNQMKNGYKFDYNYLLKIKKDSQLFKDSPLKNLYNFAKCENDPFFLNLLENNNNSKNKKGYKYLTASEDTLKNINKCMFILDQEEMYYKISQTQNRNNNNEDNEINNEENNDPNIKNENKNLIGTNFQGNLEKTISQLKQRNEYQHLFFNSGESKDPLILNTNINDNLNNKYDQGLGPYKIPATTSNELLQSFQYYDKIKNNIFNREEIENMQKELNINDTNKYNNKITIISKNVNSQNNCNGNNNQKNNKVSLKASGGLSFNNLYKINNSNSDNEKKSPVKLSFNSINKKTNEIEKLKKNYDLNLKISNNNANSVNKKENLDINKKDNENNNNNIKNSLNENAKNKSKDKNIDNNNNKEVGNNIHENIILDNDKEEEDEKKNEKCINFKYISIVSLINKNDSSNKNNEQNRNNNFTMGNILFRGMNTFNINLLLNSLKNNNKYSLSNFDNSIITSSPEEIRSSFNFIKRQNNNVPNISILTNNLKEKNIIYLSDNNINNYAYLSSLINIDFNSLVISSIKYNDYSYNGIKINSSKNVISIEDDITLYTIPTNDENILIYICPYNDKIKEIIKKYDKNSNIFNGFSTFVNLISLYTEDNNGGHNENDKMVWLPCFEVDTQLICSKIPGYNKLNIKNNNDNSETDVFEYDEIIKINMKSNYNNNNGGNVEVNKNEDIIIENDFLIGLYHKEMKNKYNNPFISLTFIGKDNFLKAK